MPSPLRSLLAAALLAAGLTACSGGDAETETAKPAAPDVVKAISRALDSRARVVRRADPDAFARWVGGTAEFRDQQRTWFTNVTQLPVRRLQYTLEPDSLVRDGDSYLATAAFTLQLEGYDAAPVTTPTRLRFRPAPRHPSRFLLTAADPAEPQPWDLGPVTVQEGDGVLGVFDAGSLAAAPELLDSVESGITSVAAEVPYAWRRSVVVYALSDPAFLLGLDDVPGDEPEELDAVSFPVGEGTRFALNPAMLERAGRERDQLVRHELTHVAVGTHDDMVPVWLSEGLAEYVAVRPLAPEDRRIPTGAVRAAEAGVRDLPADETFNDADSSDANYGLSWWAVEYLADAYGENAPWQLLDEMAAPGADPDAILREGWGTSTKELAAQAERLILALYDPSAGVP